MTHPTAMDFVRLFAAAPVGAVWLQQTLDELILRAREIVEREASPVEGGAVEPLTEGELDDADQLAGWLEVKADCEEERNEPQDPANVEWARSRANVLRRLIASARSQVRQPPSDGKGGGGWTFLEDREGLERWRTASRIRPGHDMANANNNTVQRFVQTIDKLEAQIADLRQVRQPVSGEVVEALQDVKSHEHDWRKALEAMKKFAKDDADETYWQHQLEVLDRIVAALSRLNPTKEG